MSEGVPDLINRRIDASLKAILNVQSECHCCLWLNKSCDQLHHHHVKYGLPLKVSIR